MKSSTKKTISVLSLFDGISCARVALERAGISVLKYYSSEIDMYANQIAKKNYPDNIYLGNVKVVRRAKVGKIDLLIGGSPCQDLSIAKNNRKGLDGDRSGLFWEYVRVLKDVKPKYFILENVNSMPKSAKDEISKAVGVQPIMINAALVSAQSRKRLFWTNIPNVTLPEDQGIMLKDILDGVEKSKKSDKKNGIMPIGHIGKGGMASRIYSPNGKSVTLKAGGGGGGAKTGLYLMQRGRGFNKGGKHFDKSPTLSSSSWEHNHKLVIPAKSKTIRTSGRGSGIGNKHNWDQFNDGDEVRNLSPIECERLQGLPDDYTRGVIEGERYKMLGNAFNVDVITHILKFIP